MNQQKTVVTVGKYKFQIIDNILMSEDTGNIYNQSFTPLKIYNGTPEGCLTRDSRATLPINRR